MSSYAIFFDYKNTTYRLPTNPEQIETTSVQAIEKFEILKLGQIAIPTHMELKQYNFECEFPHDPLPYIETSGGFREPDFYISLFQKLRDELVSVRFIASNGIGEDINSLVLIEDMTVTEKAGEEGDKYMNFSLLEYREFGKKSVVITTPATGTVATLKKEEAPPSISPKANDAHVVQSGDSLWAIAKKYYGDGNQYAKIVSANKSTIKNPALIYPGQKLVIPA
jgi:LysM repeat protein